jgi:hypothetical protein
MTPLVADKTPIPAKVLRRHTDPPGFWISVVIGSVSLHLLVFWLMRSSNTFSLWFPQPSQSAIPIELIDIAPQTQSTAKTVSPKRLSSTQKSVPVRLSQTARTTPKNQDFGAINSTDNLQIKKKTNASQTNKQRFKQKTVPKPTPKPTVSQTNNQRFRQKTIPKAIPIPTPTPKPTVFQTNNQRFRQKTFPKAIPIPTPTPTPTPTVPVSNLPWNRRTKITLGTETPLPTGIPSEPPVKETPPTPIRETRPAPTPNTETSPTSTQGGSIAIVAPLGRDEVNNLIKTRRWQQDAPLDAIAQYKGSSTKQLDSSFLLQDLGLKPAKLLANLIIDRNGKFQKAVVLEIEPATLENEKIAYQQVLNQVFQTENFVAGHNNDGKKPDLSDLYVWIKIQPANSP